MSNNKSAAQIPISPNDISPGYICAVCNQVFGTFPERDNHQKNTHKSPSKPSISCPVRENEDSANKRQKTMFNVVFNDSSDVANSNLDALYTIHTRYIRSLFISEITTLYKKYSPVLVPKSTIMVIMTKHEFIMSREWEKYLDIIYTSVIIRNEMREAAEKYIEENKQ